MRHLRPSTTMIRLCILSLLFLTGCGGGRESFLRESVLLGDAGDNTGDGSAVSSAIPNPYDSLSVPTCIRKIGDLYFIVDCYHDQVLYHDNLTDPVAAWSVLPGATPILSEAPLSDAAVQGEDIGTLRQPHTIAGDGVVYLVDDTENNRVLVYEKNLPDEDAQNPEGATPTAGFALTQYFDSIGVRPHFTVYDEETQTFYVWSSFSGEMYLFTRREQDNRVLLKEILRVPELAGVYVRSFTIDGDRILFVSGLPVPDEVYGEALGAPLSSGVDATSSALQAPVSAPLRSAQNQGPPDLVRPQGEGRVTLLPLEKRASGVILACDKKTLAVKERYAVPEALAGMVQIYKITSSALQAPVSAPLRSAQNQGPPDPVRPQGEGWLVTVSTDLQGNADAATMLFCAELSDLADGSYEEVYATHFVGGGTPYFMGDIDGTCYLTEHRLPGHSIWSFRIDDGGISDVTPVY